MDSKILVDDNAPFGTYAGNRQFDKQIQRLRRLPRNWLGKRLMFIMRQMARKHIGDCVDMKLFGARLRLYKEGNNSEKRALYTPQFFDYEERLALADLAEDGAVFVDIGANIGLYSFSASEAFSTFKSTRILAVEPHPDIHRRLAFNAAQKPSLTIDLFQGGIGDKVGNMELVTGIGNLGQTHIMRDKDAKHGESITVPVITLMDLCEKFNLTRIDGMKVDVEGFEEAVMLPFLEQASDKLLPRLIVIEDNRDAWQTDILAAAKARGYRLAKKTKMNLLLKLV